jgi:hypothetical protein
MALQLSTQAFGPLALAAAPPGGAPSHIEFSITSSGGPFCIVGFYIDASVPGTPPAGKVEIELSRINGNGVIHEKFELADGPTVRPQDLVVSYGSVISTAWSLSFHAVQWPATSGPGVPVNLEGRIVFFADDSVTLTIS